MNTKYEFVPGDEITISPGRTVKRIRALVAIAAFGVAPGDLGGYVEHEMCLSSDGDAWVSGDARVYGNARVYGDAMVSGDAWVYGDAMVSGDAWVYCDARVSGNARVSGDARVSGNARVSGDGLIFWASKVGTENGTLTVCAASGGGFFVSRGCFAGTVDKFLEASERKHDTETHLEYRMLIEVAISRINRARAKESA